MARAELVIEAGPENLAWKQKLWREAIALVAEGVCDAETVDTVVKASFGRRLPVLGPLENADLVGIELTQAIHQTVLPAINGDAFASSYLAELIAAEN